jgi:hypothetical protein
MMGGYFKTRDLVEKAKAQVGITKPNSDMDDHDIRETMRWIGIHSPDTNWVNGEPRIGRMGIALMLFVTICEFPRFFERYDLGPPH